MITVVAGVIRSADGAVLLARRAPGRKLAGYYEFPGGKIDPGETPEQALARELLEELDIIVNVGAEIGRTLHDSPTTGVIQLVALEATIVSGTPVLRDHDDLQYLPPSQLHTLPIAPADLFLLPLL